MIASPHHRTAAGLLFAGLLLLAGSVRAQPASVPDTLALRAVDDDPAPRWRAGASLNYEALENDQPDWQTYGVMIRRKGGGYTVALEGLRVSRFHRTDYAGVVDAYAELWRGAYGNLRLQAAPDAEVLPSVDASGELFQAVAQVWELSAGYRLMHFSEDDVSVFSAGLARYVGNYYLRGRATLVPHDGRRDFYFNATARRYFASSDEYVEVAAGRGREVIALGGDARFDVRQAAFASLRAQRTVLGPLALTLGLSYTDDEAYARWGLTAGAFLNW